MAPDIVAGKRSAETGIVYDTHCNETLKKARFASFLPSNCSVSIDNYGNDPTAMGLNLEPHLPTPTIYSMASAAGRLLLAREIQHQHAVHRLRAETESIQLQQHLLRILMQRQASQTLPQQLLNQATAASSCISQVPTTGSIAGHLSSLCSPTDISQFESSALSPFSNSNTVGAVAHRQALLYQYLDQQHHANNMHSNIRLRSLIQRSALHDSHGQKSSDLLSDITGAKVVSAQQNQCRGKPQESSEELTRASLKATRPVHTQPRRSTLRPLSTPFALSDDYLPLGIDEDHNWLSPYHCYVRSELAEVFVATEADCKGRSHVVRPGQVGIRCRYCAQVDVSSRICRAAAYPSSLQQVYQSFNMMLRDHFQSCPYIPEAVQQHISVLREKPTHGAPETKNYWVYSAMKLGLKHCVKNKGIVRTDEAIAEATTMAPFGSLEDDMPNTIDTSLNKDNRDKQDFTQIEAIPFQNLPDVKTPATDYLMALLDHVQLVSMTSIECMANRRYFTVGTTGLACRYCCLAGRRGLCRVFPGRRRVLLTRLQDLHDHFMRCSLFPSHQRENLGVLRTHSISKGDLVDSCSTRRMMDTLWTWMGREHDSGEGDSG
jgi:hypothetical protein